MEQSCNVWALSLTTTFPLLLRFFLLRFISVGMSELVKERPANPIEWLASYLIANDPQKKGPR